MDTQEQEQIFHILKVYGENISCYYNNILEKEFEDEDLHLFRTNIRRSRALLHIFYPFFEEETYTKINETLLNITQNTNKIRDLTVFLEAYKTSLTPYSNQFPESFYSYLFNELENEKNKLYQFLKIDKNQQDFYEYLIILEDKSKRKDISTDIVVYLRNVVSEHFEEIMAFYTTYKIDGNEKNLHNWYLWYG
jgi:CHAD domain-containing protein